MKVKEKGFYVHISERGTFPPLKQEVSPMIDLLAFVMTTALNTLVLIAKEYWN